MKSFKSLSIICLIVSLFLYCNNQVSLSDTKTKSKRLQIVQDAKGLLGSTYRYGGKKPSVGFDCSGMIYYVMGKHGVSMNASAHTQYSQGKKITLNQAQAGDLLFFKRKNEDRIFHVSLISRVSQDEIWVIHSTSSRGVIEERFSSSVYWKPKLIGVRDVLSGA